MSDVYKAHLIRGQYLGYFMGDECGGPTWLLWKAPSGDIVGVPDHQIKEHEYPEITLHDPVTGRQFLVSLPPNYWDGLEDEDEG